MAGRGLAWPPGRGVARQAAPIITHGLQQGAGLQAMHVAQFIFGERAAHGGEVDRLAAGHARAARGLRQQPAQARLHDVGNAAQLGRQQLEGQRLQRVAGQQRGGLTELHVHRRLAAAQDVVVHAGHVVVHQRIRVDQLHRAGRAQGCFGVSAHGLAGSQHEQRAQPLAAIEHRVAHGFAKPGGRLQRHPCRERAFHLRESFGRPPLQIERHRSTSALRAAVRAPSGGRAALTRSPRA